VASSLAEELADTVHLREHSAYVRSRALGPTWRKLWMHENELLEAAGSGSASWSLAWWSSVA
jgi:hypothetical protein